MNKIWALVFLVVLLAGSSSCRRTAKEVPGTMLTGEATIAADRDLKPLLESEIGVFQSIYNASKITCTYGSESDAVSLLIDEKVRLAIVTRPLRQTETDYFQSKKIFPESILLGYDAVAVVTHSGNGLKALTIRQISEILLGKISSWDEIEGSGKTGEIKIVFDAKSSGVIRALNDSLNLGNKLSGNFCFAGSGEEVINLVKTESGAIGFVGFALISETDNRRVQDLLQGVNLIAVSNLASGGNYYPTQANLYNFKYPLMRKIYALYTDPAASLARGFLALLTSERGQRIIYRMGLKPQDDFQRLVNIKKEE